MKNRLGLPKKNAREKFFNLGQTEKSTREFAKFYKEILKFYFVLSKNLVFSGRWKKNDREKLINLGL